MLMLFYRGGASGPQYGLSSLSLVSVQGWVDPEELRKGEDDDEAQHRDGLSPATLGEQRHLFVWRPRLRAHADKAR